MKNKTQICDNCKRELYDIGKGEEGHYWWCKKRPVEDLLEDISKHIQILITHLNAH